MIHSDTASMIHESVQEMLHVAGYCLATRKPLGGCYGYPLAILLFSIMDAIGSYYAGAKYLIMIDGKERKIKKKDEHIYILNSPYYNQTLTLHKLTKLYANFRSLLTHNLALPPNHFLIMDEPMAPLLKYDQNNQSPFLNVTAFYRLTESAAEKFLPVIADIIATSKNASNISKKTF